MGDLRSTMTVTKDFTKTFFVPETYYQIERVTEGTKQEPPLHCRGIVGILNSFPTHPVVLPAPYRASFQPGRNYSIDFLTPCWLRPFMIQQGDGIATGVTEQTVHPRTPS